MEKKICELCKSKFLPKYRVTKRYWATRRFCSPECARIGMKGERRSTFGVEKKPLVARFWEKVAKGGSSECWEWQGAKDLNGYGFLYSSERPKRWKKAHRLSYELANGPIPKGMCVCHSCDNPPCVNPQHLWLGTLAENNADKVAKGRDYDKRGSANPNVKLTAQNVMEIKQLRNSGWTQQQIADRFNIAQPYVSRVLRGETWKHLEI